MKYSVIPINFSILCLVYLWKLSLSSTGIVYALPAHVEEGRVKRQIYPGTKWCGAGNMARNFDDLGTSSETDKCCRDHDNCKYFIEAGSTNYSLHNYAPYTISECRCDKRFRMCLGAASEPASKMIRWIYFGLLGIQCFHLRNDVAEWVESK